MSRTPLPLHPFKALLPNLAGTDFFVGDIHGNFERLTQDLQTVRFNPAIDRLICAGDLVDRGADSDVAQTWLQQPFFYTVRGNHEDLYLRWRGLRHRPQEQAAFEEDFYFRHGGRWVQQVTEYEHQQMEERFRELPYFLAVSAPDGRTVGVVHAELPDGVRWPTLLQHPRPQELFHTMVWGRERFRHWRATVQGTPPETVFSDGHVVAGLDALVCGHVVVPHPLRVGNIVYVDTGGWRPDGFFSVMRMSDLLAMTAAKP